jgi:hypothetical protein
MPSEIRVNVSPSSGFEGNSIAGGTKTGVALAVGSALGAAVGVAVRVGVDVEVFSGIGVTVGIGDFRGVAVEAGPRGGVSLGMVCGEAEESDAHAPRSHREANTSIVAPEYHR